MQAALRFASPAAHLVLPGGSDFVSAAEVPWVIRNINNYHAEAVKAKVKIVHFCGFESIPADIGTAFVVEHMQEKLHK